ncbi:MAG: hypothetical protein KGH63_04020 [Candidatus Micrarchaeota archaeon]|nr:hypothetical protein [Candidatus Micrarchaeota archaeon]
MRPEKACQVALATTRKSLWLAGLGLPALARAQEMNLADNLSNVTANGTLSPSALSAPAPSPLITLPADWVSYAAILIVLGVTVAYQLRKRY